MLFLKALLHPIDFTIVVSVVVKQNNEENASSSRGLAARHVSMCVLCNHFELFAASHFFSA